MHANILRPIVAAILVGTSSCGSRSQLTISGDHTAVADASHPEDSRPPDAGHEDASDADVSADAQHPVSCAWSRQFGSSAHLLDTDTDTTGNVYIAGFYSGLLDFGSGAEEAKSTSGFIARLNPQGHVLWHRFVHGTGPSATLRVAAGASDTVHALMSVSTADGPRFVLTTFSSSGSEAWSNPFPAGGYAIGAPGAAGLATTASGDVVFGVSGKFDGNADHTLSYAHVSSNGEVTWVRSVEWVDIFADAALATIPLAPAGNDIMTAGLYTNNPDLGTPLPPADNVTRTFVAAFDGTGNTIFASSPDISDPFIPVAIQKRGEALIMAGSVSGNAAALSRVTLTGSVEWIRPLKGKIPAQWLDAVATTDSIHLAVAVQGAADFGSQPIPPVSPDPKIPELVLASFESNGGFVRARRLGGKATTPPRIAALGTDVVVAGSFEGVLDFGETVLTAPGPLASIFVARCTP